jgi:predicted RNA-binding Zn-ribbon protein involved in translation (DUF1610 family)
MSQLTFYPNHEEVDFSDERCPNCGHQCFVRTCWECGGDGCFDGYEIDPLWYLPNDLVRCDTCYGKGYHHWCPRCGWDMNLPAKWNTPMHRGKAIAKYDPRLAEVAA